jgi:hypothetical protein
MKDDIEILWNLYKDNIEQGRLHKGFRATMLQIVLRNRCSGVWVYHQRQGGVRALAVGNVCDCAGPLRSRV